MSARQTFLNCETMSWKFVSAVKLKPLTVSPLTDSVTSGSVCPETCSSKSGSGLAGGSSSVEPMVNSITPAADAPSVALLMSTTAAGSSNASLR